MTSTKQPIWAKYRNFNHFGKRNSITTKTINRQLKHKKDAARLHRKADKNSYYRASATKQFTNIFLKTSSVKVADENQYF